VVGKVRVAGVALVDEKVTVLPDGASDTYR
jgi:hypothetical protein